MVLNCISERSGLSDSDVLESTELDWMCKVAKLLRRYVSNHGKWY